jgi:hypothetical protein
LEENGDQSRSQQSDDQVALRLEEHPEHADDQHVQPDHAGGQGAIHQCAVKDEIDIVEAVFEDGKCDGNDHTGNGQLAQGDSYIHDHIISFSNSYNKQQQKDPI